ncbi:hypothetical protein BDV26DRAFT_287651 [Aspergillus bertholletiae]|uniref:LicD family-domain-containing protein n=1 Tax=Aspergillus bertholletiae TaxID=1226010 RepID=A0A5N7BP68_9EURO|nr:hypothetical protein BDV26DRAFT_287651 [Aspergillus bertholletiae]
MAENMDIQQEDAVPRTKAPDLDLSNLHEAVARVSQVLLDMGVTYVIIGGYATALLCEHRITEDIDIIVDAEPGNVRETPQQQPGFYMSRSYLMYQPGQVGKPAVKCDILRGGATEHLRLPSAATVKVINVNSLWNDLNERPKILTISNVQAFYHLAKRCAEARPLLEKVLEKRDFEVIQGPPTSEDS